MNIDTQPVAELTQLRQLQDKIAVIVGAGSLRGIGYGTAELFARHGAKIAVVDIMMNDGLADEIASSIAVANGTAPEVIGLRCDIQDAAACEETIATVIGRFGRIDCLVNSAAIVKAQGMLEVSGTDLDRMIDVNLKGAFNICQATLRSFERQNSGSIVNVASVAAQRGGGLVGGAHYAASKGGVISLTRSIAREFGSKGIRANIVCPSMIETGMLDGMTKEQFAQIVDAVPLKRVGKPLDIANACLFLASDLSAYITGATLDVNGGSHIH